MVWSGILEGLAAVMFGFAAVVWSFRRKPDECGALR
jgi:hypothetical protein